MRAGKRSLNWISGRKTLLNMALDKGSPEYGYYSSGNVSGKSGLQLIETLVLEIKKISGIKNICELGCGNGFLANNLATMGYEVIGVDESESGIRIARSNSEPKAEFHVAGIDSKLVEVMGGRVFDLILSVEVIEHLYFPSGLLDVAQKILRPKGKLVLTTPYHGYAKNLMIALLNRCDSHYNPLWDGGHIKFFSVNTLTELIERYGFSDLSYRYVGRLPFVAKSMIVTAVKS